MARPKSRGVVGGEAKEAEKQPILKKITFRMKGSEHKPEYQKESQEKF